MKILLVEDSTPIRRENECALHKAGYEVICAEDGETALQMARPQKPDLVLLDMILPRMSGPEVLRHLKSEPITGEIPVVVLSSLSAKNRQRLLAEAQKNIGEKCSDARQGSQPAPAGFGERDLPHQPQTRHRIFIDPLALVESL